MSSSPTQPSPLTLSDNIRGILRCSHCGAKLAASEGGAHCEGCARDFPRAAGGALDLRLQGTKNYAFDLDLNTPVLPDPDFAFGPLTPQAQPEVDFSPIKVPYHLTPQLLSHFPRAPQGGGLALDLGCGNGLHRSVCEHAGFEWVGLDYGDEGAPMFGDAHALPFADESFDFILSIAVLEHIRYPLVMTREARRVLKPGGRFVGTVAFLEPFHGDSYYHHTHLGTLNSLQAGGFRVDKVAAIKEWPVLTAQASMGLFPRMPGPLARGVMLPAQIIHRIWWRMAGLVSEKADENSRIRRTAGAFAFVASRPAA